MKKNQIKQLEKMRFSILTNDLEHCYICGAPKSSIHEIFYGNNRTNSMKWGCCVPLCFNHHTGAEGVHKNHELDIMLKKECQQKFEEVYPEIDFLEIFHKYYV